MDDNINVKFGVKFYKQSLPKDWNIGINFVHNVFNETYLYIHLFKIGIIIGLLEST